MRDFDEAEHLVASDPEKQSRLMPLVGPAEGQALRDWYRDAIEDFFASAQRNGVTHMREAGRHASSMEDFRRLLEASPPDQGSVRAGIE